MFGPSVGGIFGEFHYFSLAAYEHLGLTIPLEAYFIFQTVFAGTAATIVSGAMAERTKFSAYIIYSIVISLIIYPIVGHWIWGGGWLSKLSFHDFAGSTVVHSVGGWTALVGAAMIGPRIGKYTKKGKSNSIPGHSITLGALGVFILWFGWFGFNPGSTLSGQNVNAISHIFVTTNLAASAAAVVAMTITWVQHRKPDVGMTLNGGLGGLVAITAGTDIVSPESAIVIGIIAGFIVVFGNLLIDRILKVDDPVGAISVHALCGVSGTLLVGIFASEGGLFATGSWTLLGIQALGVLAVGTWTVMTTFILFKIIDKLVGLRVSASEERAGLDFEEHGLVNSYPDFKPMDPVIDSSTPLPSQVSIVKK